ncbi:uncharacterized protein LOC113791169 isoform X2 [Dermatophagoides pteronyssinus]|uniref:uncharacterized protein LOC113791169 isoform X2 n=1 Tax=Dermatophagoides pteronyssinus TaxID=6956 RepID=UPI003F66AFA8
MFDKSDDDDVYGPVLPKNFPKLKTNDDNDEKCQSNDDVYGPTLPSSSLKVPIGPSLPENFQSTSSQQDDEDDDDDFIIGPLPPGEIDRNHLNNQNRSIKNDRNDTKREKWMLEPGKSLGRSFQLPTKSVTKFSQKTSATKKPLTEDELMEIRANEQKDKKIEQFLEKFDKTNNRERSLMEMHRKDLKNNKKPKATDSTATKQSERREFDREKDLCAPRMDSKRKKSLINAASDSFGTKFSRGKFEKFL